MNKAVVFWNTAGDLTEGKEKGYDEVQFGYKSFCLEVIHITHHWSKQVT